jgi:hypothetical protein
VAEPQGPLVLPGDYQVRLTVGGQTYTQALRVELDPRVHLPDSALIGQLGLALEIWNTMAEQQALSGDVRGLGTKLREVAHRNLDRAGRTRLTTLDQLSDSIARGVRAVSGELASLETVVESADRAPTQQARDVFAELRGRLGRAKERWQRALTSDLPELNAELRRQGAPSLQAPAQARDSIAGP